MISQYTYMYIKLNLIHCLHACTMVQYMFAQYSGISNEGLSVIRTHYKKPPYIGQDFLPQTIIFKPLKRAIMDN